MHRRYRAGQGSNELQKATVRIDSGGTPQYLPPGGRWLGAQPQDGGSQRVQHQFGGQGRYLPRRVGFLKLISGKSTENRFRVPTKWSKYQPICKPSAYRPQAPSVTAYAVPAPFNKGAFFIRYRSMVRCRAFSCFQSTAWERNTPKYHNPKRGQRLKPTTRAKAKGQSRMVPPGGFLRGG